jgi:hypothetical protein
VRRSFWLLLVPLSLVGLVDVSQGRTRFTDVTAEAGLRYLQHVPPPPPACVVGHFACDVDRQTGGAAVADVDGDGWLDLFVTRFDAPDLLFRNQRDGRFQEVSQVAGLAVFDLNSNGAAFGDIDNDGDPDLLVTTIGTGADGVNDRNYLFVNDGAGRFEEQALVRGAANRDATPRLSWSATWGDYDGDGFLDLHTTEWLGSGHSRLLRNRGVEAPGHFEDATEAAGLDFEGVNGFASTFVDLDGDGLQDLAVAADFLTSRLFWNDGDGTFTDGTTAAGVGTDENGMGSTFGDIDGDGDLDWFVSSIFDPDATCSSGNCVWGDTGNRLYRNEGGRVFSDATDAAGVRDGAWGWGAVFLDFDNDGDLDLVMTNGLDVVHTTIEDAFNADSMRVWENDGQGHMTEVALDVGIDDTGSGKGLLSFDYDADGDLDLFVVNNAGEPRLYRNEAPRRNRWLRLRVEGMRSNRDGLGARVRVWKRPHSTPQVREVGVASHFLGQSEPVLHFGLGQAGRRVYRVQVEFPASGQVVERRGLRANRTHVIREDEPRCGRLGPEWSLAFVPGLWQRVRRVRHRSRDVRAASLPR